MKLSLIKSHPKLRPAPARLATGGYGMAALGTF
jgi:hypothetical protein